MISLADTILTVAELDTLTETCDTCSVEVHNVLFYNMATACSPAFFTDSTLLHTELDTIQYGRDTEPLPYMLWRDNWISGTLLVVFVLLVYTFNRASRPFILQAKNFTYTPQNSGTPFARGITFEPQSVVLMILLLSLLGGFLTYVYSQYALNLFLSRISPYLFLFIYVGCFLLYFLLKRIAYSFTNWVFFEKQHKLWMEAYYFVLSVECLLLFPAVLIFVYFYLSMHQILITLFCVLLFSKILLAYKCFSIFFPNFYCLIHFFAYLCALEVVPLILLWKSLTLINGFLIIKY